MNVDDIARYARRDWKALAESKSSYWAAESEAHGAERLIRVGDSLRLAVLDKHPGWPTEEDRRLDFESHLRVSAALSHAASAWRR